MTKRSNNAGCDISHHFDFNLAEALERTYKRSNAFYD